MSTRHYLGKYRLIAELGHGGMADVFLALIEGPAGSGFTKLAVVKRLRANLAEDPEFVAMLIDEARITARLNHPNVVQMLEVGVVEDEYFLAMEYLDGQPLHRIERRAARSGRELPKSAQIAVLRDVLAGLHHAHELVDYDGTPLNVVHRDVTPHNIFVTYDGQIKVMDFGIAKAAGRAQETQHGIVKGKTRYMSPEQAMGQPLDRRADIFAVGILLWQVATGKRFWDDLDELAIVQALIAGNYQASPRALCPEVPEGLDRICRKALARDAQDRYATALEMRDDLETFVDGTTLAGRRELVAILNESFDKERRELRAVVQKVGKGSASVTPSLAILAQRMSASSTSVPAVTHSVPPPASGSDGAPVAAVARDLPPSSRSTARTLVSGGLVVAALGVVGFAALSFSGQQAGRTAAPAVVATDFVRLEATPARKRASALAGLAEAPEPPRFGGASGWWRPASSPASAPAVVEISAPASTGAAPATTVAPLHSARSASQRRLNVDTADPWPGSSPK